MKRLLYVLLASSAFFGLQGCNECSVIEDSGNPLRRFRLLDASGNDLWFGANAIYDPAEAVFQHQSEGALMTSVNTSKGSVDVLIPMSNGNERSIELRLDSVTSSQLKYAAILYEENCERNYELSYMFQDGTKICSLCGTTQFENDGFIYLTE